jgi:3-dehydroquinate dehydratase type I
LTVSTARAAEVADLIEFRLDGLERGELEGSISQLADLIANTKDPLSSLFAVTKEGGYRLLTLDQRIAFWDQLFELNAAFFDIEGELVPEFTNRDENDQPDWSRVIGSYHDFKGVPANLNDIYEQLSFTPVRIVKVACKQTTSLTAWKYSD